MISMSRYNVAADNILRCGQAVIYPAVESQKCVYCTCLCNTRRLGN